MDIGAKIALIFAGVVTVLIGLGLLSVVILKLQNGPKKEAILPGILCILSMVEIVILWRGPTMEVREIATFVYILAVMPLFSRRAR